MAARTAPSSGNPARLKRWLLKKRKGREVNCTGDSRGAYVREPDGHGYEPFMADPARTGASR